MTAASTLRESQILTGPLFNEPMRVETVRANGDVPRGRRLAAHLRIPGAGLQAAEEAVKDEVWAGYRFVVLADNAEPDGLRVIDLGAGHASSSETLCGRVIAALRAEALLNESVGAGYIDRHWPPALTTSGAWPLSSLRQSFLNGALTRLIDPDAVLRGKIVEFVMRGDFGLASGPKPDGTYERVWFKEMIGLDEVTFEPGVFLLKKSTAEICKSGAVPVAPGGPTPPAPSPEAPPLPPSPDDGGSSLQPAPPGAETQTIRLVGEIPPEVWNRFGMKVLPKLRSAGDLQVDLSFAVNVKKSLAASLHADLSQILSDLGLMGKVRIE